MARIDHFRSKHGFGRIALTSAALGVLVGLHAAFLIAFPWPSVRQWAVYVIAMCTFHFMEFTWACAYDPIAVSTDAFLLNHSPQYHMAVVAGIIEFLLELIVAPVLKTSFPAIAVVGAVLVVGGQALRIAAMWHAGHSFTHLVAEERREGHTLVTTGVYSILRHPAYTGWFWWSVGTQLLLCNPVCILLYALAARKFFADRIPHEEDHLIAFFGARYLEYAQKTWICIPGITSRVCLQHAAPVSIPQVSLLRSQ